MLTMFGHLMIGMLFSRGTFTTQVLLSVRDFENKKKANKNVTGNEQNKIN